MPLLAQEPDLFPDDLLESGGQPAPGRVWQVAHTLPRREKDLARRLLSLEVPFYLPQMKQQWRSPAGRRRVAYLPLFPGYLFLSIAEEQHWPVLDTGCIARLLAVPDPEEFVFDLRQIHRLTHSGAPLVREPKFEPGMSVRIVSGPFTGYEGHVINCRAGDRLLVAIHYLQQGISISLEGCQVEKA